MWFYIKSIYAGGNRRRKNQLDYKDCIGIIRIDKILKWLWTNDIIIKYIFFILLICYSPKNIDAPWCWWAKIIASRFGCAKWVPKYKQVNMINVWVSHIALKYFCNSHNGICCYKNLPSESIRNIFLCTQTWHSYRISPRIFLSCDQY